MLLLSTAFLSAPALAEEAAGDEVPTIIVTGQADGYVATNSVSALKTDTPLIDVPQTVSVITRQQLDDQAQHSIADVLRYVPGTTVGQGEGNRDQITIRGQNTTADFFVDGVRDDVQYYRTLYNIERVEILKGATALLFGRGGGGGIINRVQKAPSAEQTFGAVAASLNSFGNWDVAADLNAPLGDRAAVRLNGFYESLANHRDGFDGERYAFNPYVAAELGDGWKAGLSYEYVKDDRVTDRGIPSLACAQPCTPGPLPGNRDTFFGVRGVNRTGLEAHLVKGLLEGQLAENVSWSTALLYGHYDKYYRNVYANGAATSPTGTVALAAYTDPTTRENVIAQTNLVWDVTTGPVAHKLLFGLEYGHQTSANQRTTGVVTPGSISLANPVTPVVAFTTRTNDRQSAVDFFSAYAQNQLSFGAHVDVVIGLRYDRFDIAGTDFIPNPDRAFGRVDEKVSPRLGLILKPQENMSVYTSYSQSFLPRSGDQFLALSTTQQNLAPEKFTNLEVGAKWDVRPDLSATLALFRLDRTNATTPDPANPLVSINVGETRTKGMELGVVGRVSPAWQVSGGYTYQDAHLRGNSFVRLAQVPRHQVALWNRYNVSSAFGAGLGIIRQSAQFAAIRTSPATTRLPGYTRVDAALYLKASDALQLQLNVENLFDRTYFSEAHNNNNISTGAPFNVRVSARVKF
ncbi:TonB-dependent siderophore receptor [Chakrabartia godavariana]|nr:TonB-dependent siderophore receptor [Chakrabartia godavariana]